jgi:hypothetical protein
MNGFKASRHVGGGVQRYSQVGIAAAYATAIYNGDMVKMNGGDAELAATNETMVGTFVGVMYVSNNGAQIFSPYWPGAAAAPGATEIKALVSDDTKITYKVEDGSAALVAGDLCDLDYVAGTAKLGQSAAKVGASTNGDFRVRSVLNDGLNSVEVDIV